MTTETAVNCHERGLGRNHRWDQGGVCARCGADRTGAVAAALEEGRVRPVGQRARQQASARCPRCGGTVLAERDEDGDLDPACLACGRHTNAPTPEQVAALRSDMDPIHEETGRRRRPPSRRGMWL